MRVTVWNMRWRHNKVWYAAPEVNLNESRRYPYVYKLGAAHTYSEQKLCFFCVCPPLIGILQERHTVRVILTGVRTLQICLYDARMLSGKVILQNLAVDTHGLFGLFGLECTVVYF